MIPKTIHYCWFGRNPKSKLDKKCIESWKKYCPEFTIMEWNEDNYDYSKVPFMREAYEAKKWGFVPDYARLDIIYRYGGIYLDTDVELLRPIDELLELKGFAGFENMNYVALGLGFGAEPGNRLIKELMDSYRPLHFRNPDGTVNMTPAPRLNTEILVKHGLVRDNSLQVIEDITIFPSDYFNPRSGYGGSRHLTQNTFSDHHFEATWASKEDKRTWWKRMKKREIKNSFKRGMKLLLGAKGYEFAKGCYLQIKKKL